MSDIVPRNGEYHEGNLWFDRRVQSVTVGLTSAAILALGELESVELPSEGEDYEQGDVMGTVEGTQGSLEILAPASCSVIEVNESAGRDPAVVQEDPVEEGWLFKVQVTQLDELKKLPGA
jgi:glycine cleavage system H protein